MQVICDNIIYFFIVIIWEVGPVKVSLFLYARISMTYKKSEIFIVYGLFLLSLRY